MASEHSGAAEFTRFQSQSAQRNVIVKLLVWLIVLLFLAVAALVFGKMLFSLETIVIDGTDHYSYKQILKETGVREGDVIFFLSEKRLNQKLTERFAYIKSVKLEKQYPSTVILTLEEEEPAFYFEMQGEYYLLTCSLRVLERYRDEAKLLEEAPDVQYIQIPTVSRCVVSDALEFAEDSRSRHTDEALTMLTESRLYEGVTEINFSDRFDLTIVYEDRLEIHFGSFKDYAYKLDLALGMIHAYSDKAVGTLEIIYDADDELKGIATVQEAENSSAETAE